MNKLPIRKFKNTAIKWALQYLEIGIVCVGWLTLRYVWLTLKYIVQVLSVTLELVKTKRMNNGQIQLAKAFFELV